MMTTSIAFSKLEGTGNDFVLLDFRPGGANEKEKAAVLDSFPVLQELSRRLADRHFGVGADQILVLCEGKKAPLWVRFINVDGFEAEMCGNGLRAVGVYLESLERASGRAVSSSHRLETLAGEQLLFQSSSPRVARPYWAVKMGLPKVHSKDERLSALDRSFTFRRVSMGNPHAIFFDVAPTRSELKAYGSVIENDPLFPERTNVEFVEVLSRDAVRVKVWERGAGITLSCGSGACAVVAAGIQQGILNKEVTVEMPGGELRVVWPSPGDAIELSGPARLVFQGVLNDPFQKMG